MAGRALRAAMLWAFEHIAYLYAVCPLLLGLCAFWLSLGTEDPEALRLTIYGIYGVSSLVVAIGCVLLVRRNRSGKAAVWLVAVTYEACFFAVAIVGIFCLLIVRILHPELIIPEGTPTTFAVFAQAASYGLIGAATTGTAVSAVVIAWGLRYGGLYLPTRPLPWKGRKERENPKGQG